MPLVSDVISSSERLLLIIADISGYTSYLTASELDHARDVMADLLETVLGAMGSTPRLSELEGDALFVHVPEGEIDGPMLLDTLEGCYFAFRRRIRSIAQTTTCPCTACRTVNMLDLKFCVHAGEGIRQRIAGHEKLMGSDIILVHRLLKNSVADVTGLHGYILFTTQGLKRLGLNPSALRLISHSETYDHFGQVTLYVHDLRARWTQHEDTHHVFVSSEEADVNLDFSTRAEPALVWEYLTSPEKRRLWKVGTTGAYQENPGSRRDVGTVVHCVHGEHSHAEEILDWHPFNSVTWRTQLPGFGETTITFELIPTESGTDLRIHLRLASPIPNAEQRNIADHVLADVRDSFNTLADILAQNTAARKDDLETIAGARARLRAAAARSRNEREGPLSI